MLTQEQQFDKDTTSSIVGKYDDLAKLSLLTEDILLDHLKHRYERDLIYTYLGDILVAVNPFNETNLYTSQIRDFYRYSTDIHKAPHVYALVDLVYRNVCHGIYDQQCCVISGESGSGKTESTKLFLKQLMYLCGGSSQLEQQILQATPLLESFGNAQTVMNNNSSRFGKYIALKFVNGKVIGAQISDYLLEKSRVVTQSPGERNFHIFYYLFDYLPAEMKQILCLRTKYDYKYLLTNSSSDIPNKPKVNSLDEVINAMGLLNFTDKEQHSMFRILSGILTIGNLEFLIDDEGFTRQSFEEEKIKNNLLIIASMFGVNSDLVMECLTTITTLTRNERVTRKFSLQSSQDARDALSKHLYSRLFSWLIGKINETLNNPYPIQSYHQIVEIGLLDIYGFEHFEMNSFEQLCINLANEQIQFFFNQHIFRMEMMEYESEGIMAEALTFTDNQTLLELFMAKPLGILSLLDDESRLPKATDQTFVEKLNYHFGSNKHECYSINRNNKHSFTIHHYAGKVSYCALGFLEKNRDTLSDSVVDMFKHSQDDLIRLLFHGNPSDGTSSLYKGLQHRTAAEKDARNRLTVGAQYRNSLQILMERMCASHPVFMRCLKPNQQKQAHLFDETFVRAQLRYCGMLETTRIRKEGYSVRLSFEEFIRKYGLLSKNHSENTPTKICRYILEDNKFNEWQLGKTKVFLKYYHPERLEKLMNKYRQAALLIQRRIRGHLARKQFKQLKLTTETYQNEVHQICASIEEMNNQLLNKLTQLNDKLPGKTVPVLPPESDLRPRPPIRESSLHPSSHIINNGTAGKYSLPTSKVSSSISNNTSTATTDLLVDYDSLLSYLTLKYGSPGERESCLRWFRDTQYPYVCQNGTFPSWFHGNITRHEDLLANQPIGCFLIRLSESRFGFSLSFRAEDRCRHYMINQLKNSKYNVIGEAKVHKSLDELIEYYRKHELSNWNGRLTEPCKADWSQYDHESLMPIQNPITHRPYQIKNIPNRSHTTSTITTLLLCTSAISISLQDVYNTSNADQWFLQCFRRKKIIDQNEESIQEIENLVQTLDKDGNGRIRIKDLENALQRMDEDNRSKSERSKQVRKFLTSLKPKGDRIDGEKFLQIMLERQKQLKLSFEEIDLNKDGVVDPVELAKAFSRLKIVLRKKDLMKIIEVLDRDKDFNITFSEWQTYFRFAPSTELEASLRSWRRGVQLDTINEQQIPNSYTEKERENGFYSRHFIAGAFSGMVSRTVTAPLDRLKIYMQAMGKRKLLNTATTLYGEGGGGVKGIRAFWRGNGIAVFKMTPEMALRQGIFETFRELRGDYDEIIVSPVTNKELFGLGCLSGFIAQTVIYPLEVLKTQAAMRTTGQYKSILDLIRKLYQGEGWRVFYRGYFANSLGVFPAAGIDFALYEYLRRVYREKITSLEEPSILTLTMISNVSALTAMYASYPLYLIRTRQQYQIVPENMFEMMGRIWRIDGWRGFYFGSLPNLIKVLPASTVAYLTFEYFSSLFNING